MMEPLAHLKFETDGQSQAYALRVHEIKIGRRPECDLVFNHATVSREHARIFHLDGSYYIADLDSSHGTQVGAIKLKPGDPWLLRQGDELWVGRQKLIFWVGPPAVNPVEEVASLEQHETGMELEQELAQYKAALSQHVLTLVPGSAADQLAQRVTQDFRQLEAFVSMRFKEYAVLQEVTQIIGGILDLNELLSTVLTLASRVLNADRGFILMNDPQTNELHSMVTRHFDREGGKTPEHDVQFSKTIAGSCFASKDIVIIEDALSDERFGSAHSILGSSIRSVVCLPLMKRDHVLGVLYLDNLRTPGCFHSDQMNFLKTFAAQTALALDNARLYTQAVTDGLTQVYNRKFFDERLNEELVRATRYGRQCSVLILDVDHFKRVNDTYGHHTGDIVLKAIARSLQEQARGSDLVSRYGGEEFCMLLAETDKVGARAFAERVRQTIESLVLDVDGKTIKVTISGGVATYQQKDRVSAQMLVHEADQGLYRAKQTGRNRICTMLDSE